MADDDFGVSLGTIPIPSEEEIKQEMTVFTNQGGALTVRDAASYTEAGRLVVECRNRIDRIKAYWKDEIARAHQQHKSLLGKQADMIQPVEELANGKDREMMVWKQEEDRKQREATLKAEAELRKQAEADRKREADLLRESGRASEAKALEKTPIAAPAVILPPSVPKVAGLTQQKIWRFRVVNPQKVKAAYKIINESAVAAIVKQMGPKAVDLVGGIEVYEEEINKRTGGRR